MSNKAILLIKFDINYFIGKRKEDNAMWDYILTFMVGAAVPIFNNHWQQKNDRKKFELERKDKYKLVAIEKRLCTHQEAFSLWHKLIRIIHSPSDEKIPVITEARNFWINNCLYLEKNTCKEFDIVIKLVDGYADKLQHAKLTFDPNEKEKIRQDYLSDWNRIFQLPTLIQREVELESISLNLGLNPEGE